MYLHTNIKKALVASGYADVVVEADLGLYDYCALVPVIEGAGGCISDWTGSKLTLSNHERSKGRVLASANAMLHNQALSILNTPTKQTVVSDDVPDDKLFAAINEDTGAQRINNAPVLLCGVVLGDLLAHLQQ